MKSRNRVANRWLATTAQIGNLPEVSERLR